MRPPISAPRARAGELRYRQRNAIESSAAPAPPRRKRMIRSAFARSACFDVMRRGRLKKAEALVDGALTASAALFLQ